MLLKALKEALKDVDFANIDSNHGLCVDCFRLMLNCILLWFRPVVVLFVVAVFRWPRVISVPICLTPFYVSHTEACAR